MKRQIKFRTPMFHDEKGECFAYFKYWGFIDGCFIFPPIREQSENKYSQQFTGLQDKNGNDIYEGDIVKVHYFGFEGGRESEHEAIAKILPMDEYGVSLHFIKSIYNFRIGDEPNIWPLSAISGLHEESFEVIGNIHQNPELCTP